MTVGIYSIRHVASDRRYIGKSGNIERRLLQHKASLRQPNFDRRKCNRHLWNAVQKYGWESFVTEVLEEFCEIDEQQIAERELFWIDYFKTCQREFGFNLRRDTSTKMVVHDETRALMSAAMSGECNPNFGNAWSDEQRLAMSNYQVFRHLIGDSYGPEWRRKLGIASSAHWQDENKRRAMAQAVRVTKQQRHEFHQFSRDGTFIRCWATVEEIIAANPGYKWQNIYSVCNGYKPTYMGFIWRKKEKKSEIAA